MKLRDVSVALLFLTIASVAAAKNDHDDHNHDDHDDHDDGQPNYCPKDNGMFPNPTDCSTFYNCVDGTAIAMSCAPGLLFDPEKKMCNFPDQVKCSNDCRGPNGLFPSQHRCDEFILCTNNKPKVQRCKKGLYFDANLQVCNYKDQVLCSLPGGGKKKNKKQGNKKSKKQYKDDDDDDDDYKPSGGGQKGNYASGRDTGSRSGHKELAAESVRSVCPKARGLFAHPDVCSMFYQCYDGEVLVKNCPAGLLFDEYKHTCAHGRDVDCGSRLVIKHPNRS